MIASIRHKRAAVLLAFVVFFITHPVFWAVGFSLQRPPLTTWSYVVAMWSVLHALIALFAWVPTIEWLMSRRVNNFVTPSLRWQRWLFAGLSINAFVLIASGAIEEATGSEALAAIGWLVSIFLCCGLFAYGFFIVHKENREARLAQGARYLTCFQDLRGLETTGICPECGRVYDLNKLPRQWGIGR